MGGRHFVIKYDTEKHTYMLKDLGNGHGTFLKISPQMKLCTGYVVSFGEVHFGVTIKSDADVKSDRELEIKFLEGPKAGKKLYVRSVPIGNRRFRAGSKIITMGRQKDSVVHFTSGALSRKQCSVTGNIV